MKGKIPLKHYQKYPPELKVKVCKDREKGLSLRECANIVNKLYLENTSISNKLTKVLTNTLSILKTNSG